MTDDRLCRRVLLAIILLKLSTQELVGKDQAGCLRMREFSGVAHRLAFGCLRALEMTAQRQLHALGRERDAKRFVRVVKSLLRVYSAVVAGYGLGAVLPAGFQRCSRHVDRIGQAGLGSRLKLGPSLLDEDLGNAPGFGVMRRPE